MESLKTRTRIVPINHTGASILVSPKNGEMPRYGHVFNILRLLKLESANKDNINKLLGKNSSRALLSAIQNGFVAKKDGKFYITCTGLLELRKLKSKLTNGV